LDTKLHIINERYEKIVGNVFRGINDWMDCSSRIASVDYFLDKKISAIYNFCGFYQKL
jgi:hypothetical protein